mmetsp:Transcript_31633/g.92538  ORF Transcript_31633/g.92538 Transcript_31633/m.92538 type:complete len:204 (-) Transcript_31633:16-627(-)
MRDFSWFLVCRFFFRMSRSRSTLMNSTFSWVKAMRSSLALAATPWQFSKYLVNPSPPPSRGFHTGSTEVSSKACSHKRMKRSKTWAETLGSPGPPPKSCSATQSRKRPKSRFRDSKCCSARPAFDSVAFCSFFSQSSSMCWYKSAISSLRFSTSSLRVQSLLSYDILVRSHRSGGANCGIWITTNSTVNMLRLEAREGQNTNC